jgi:hypothetical protein
MARGIVPIVLPTLILSSTLCGAAHAQLLGRYLTSDTSNGFDAYYDVQQNITWLADALYGGRKNWGPADDWIPTLRLGGYDDWRMPTFSNGSGNGTTGEFYKMWIVELGNNADQQHPVSTYNPGPFHNVEYYMNGSAYDPTAAYWTSYSYGDQAMAWMTFNAGYIGQYREGLLGYGVWLVRTGDSGWAPSACAADLDDGSGTGTADGGVDINDLLYFLAQFELGSAAADLDNGTGTGTPDGGVDINDLLFFLVHFEGGC